MNNQYNFNNSIIYNYNDYSCLKSKIEEFNKISKNLDLDNTQDQFTLFMINCSHAEILIKVGKLLSDIEEGNKNIEKIKKILEILIIFEIYINQDLNYFSIYDSTYTLNNISHKISMITRICEFIEQILYQSLLFNKYMFSISREDKSNFKLGTKYKKKIEKNGILFHDNVLYFYNIDKVDLNKFKKNLSLKKYCQEKTQDILINCNKTKDIFIYFEN